SVDNAGSAREPRSLCRGRSGDSYAIPEVHHRKHRTRRARSADRRSAWDGILLSLRPLLLLDVDGVLSPLGGAVPPGYARHRTDRYDVVVSQRHSEWLRSLTPLFELTWATTWDHRRLRCSERCSTCPTWTHWTWEQCLG